MITTTFLLLTCLLSVVVSDPNWIASKHELKGKTKYPEDIKRLKTIKTFLSIVEEHKLNVSLIASEAVNWSEGNSKSVLAVTLTFPVNSETLTESHLNHNVYSKLEKVANNDHITVAATTATNKVLDIISNNPQGVPVNKAYKIFSGIKNGKTGFVFDEENYIAQYTFLPNEANNQHTTKVLFGEVDVEIVDHSKDLNKEKVEKIKQAVVDSYFTYDDEDVPKAIFIKLNKEDGLDWEVGASVGENSYVDAKTWATIRLLGEDFLVYHS